MFWEVYYYRKPRTDFESVNTSFKGSKRVYGQKKLYCLSASFGIQGLNCAHVLILSSLLIFVKNIISKILLTAAKYFCQKAMKRRKCLLDELKTKNFHQWRSPRPIFKNHKIDLELDLWEEIRKRAATTLCIQTSFFFQPI